MFGLCFRCGDKYFPDYQCKKQLLLLEGEEGEEDEEEMTEMPGGAEEDNGEISVHTLRGLMNGKIIKVEGNIGEGKLMILIDSGSTHSFFDKGTARKLKCPLINTQPLKVTVANENKVLSKSACVGKCKGKSLKLI